MPCPDAPARPGLVVDGSGPAERLPAGWQALIDAMQGAVWLVDDATLQVVAANAAGGALVGLSPRRLVGRLVVEFAASPEDACFWDEARAGRPDDIESETFMLRHETAVPVTRRIARIPPCVVPGANGVWVVSMHDRGEQVALRRELDIAAADLRATLESTHDGLLVTDLGGRIRNFNRRFATLWALPHELLVQGDDDAVFESMRRAVADPPAYMRRLAAIDDAAEGEAIDVLHLRSGRIVERIVRPQQAQGRTVGTVTAFRDVTESVRAQQQVQSLAYACALTGLPNGRLLADRIAQSLALLRRDGSGFAVLSIDLDHFGRINHRFGRRSADDVLREVALRIAACLRQVDTVARVAGDHFAVLAQQSDAAGAEVTASRIVETLARPFLLADGRSVGLAASIGIAICPLDGMDIDTLLGHAGIAMREVKGAGRAGFRFWAAPAGRAEPASRALR